MCIEDSRYSSELCVSHNQPHGQQFALMLQQQQLQSCRPPPLARATSERLSCLTDVLLGSRWCLQIQQQVTNSSCTAADTTQFIVSSVQQLC